MAELNAPAAGPMSDERIAEIRAREQGVPPAPWRSEDDARTLERWILSEDGALEIGLGYVGNRTEDVAAFIVHARQDIPDLLAEVERLREEERRQRETAEAATNGWRKAEAEAERLRAEQAEAHAAADDTDVDWLADHVRDAVRHVLGRVEPRLDLKMMIAASEDVATHIKAGSVPIISDRVVRLAVEYVRRAEDERDRLTEQVKHLRDLTQDEDGNALPPESELPVGVFYGVLYGTEAGS